MSKAMSTPTKSAPKKAGSAKRKPKPVPKTPNEEALAECMSEMYRTGQNLRNFKWGQSSRSTLDEARHAVEWVAAELKVLHLAYPVGREYEAARILADARDSWELCQDGIVAFDPETFEGAEYFSSAEFVPSGRAHVTVRKWATTDMGRYEREREAGFSRLDSLAFEIRRAGDEFREAEV